MDTEKKLAEMLLKLLEKSYLTQDVTGRPMRSAPDQLWDEASELLSSLGY